MTDSGFPGASSNAFEEKYRRFMTEAGRQFRREGDGSEISNGYTSPTQAAWMADVLDLTPSDLLLDLGGGRGWPGTEIAGRSGCRVVIVDLPLEALRQGRLLRGPERAERVMIVCGDGRALPLGDGIFDAVCHADVLC